MQKQWAHRLSSPVAVVGAVVTQLLAVIAYVAFWIDPRPTHSEVCANLEFQAFFVAPFVWAFLFIAGLWLLRQPLTRREAVAVRGGTVLTGICAGRLSPSLESSSSPKSCSDLPTSSQRTDGSPNPSQPQTFGSPGHRQIRAFTVCGMCRRSDSLSATILRWTLNLEPLPDGG